MRWVLGLALGLACFSLADAAHAQNKKKAASTEQAESAGAEDDADKGSGEKGVQPNEKAKPKADEPDVTVTEGKEGEKTFKFGPVELEGQLKAPEVLYFLRRVRAEFRAGLLGHRSFMLELSDTRRDRAFR